MVSWSAIIFLFVHKSCSDDGSWIEGPSMNKGRSLFTLTAVGDTLGKSTCPSMLMHSFVELYSNCLLHISLLVYFPVMVKLNSLQYRMMVLVSTLWHSASQSCPRKHSTMIKKKKINFPHIQGNSDRSDCKVIYDEGLSNK